MTLLAFTAERNLPAAMPLLRHSAGNPLQQWANDGTDRRTDARQFHRLCSAYVRAV